MIIGLNILPYLGNRSTYNTYGENSRAKGLGTKLRFQSEEDTTLVLSRTVPDGDLCHAGSRACLRT